MYASAVAACRKVLQIDPQHVMVQRILGYSNLSLGQAELALSAFRTYLTHAPSGSDVSDEQRIVTALESRGS